MAAVNKVILVGNLGRDPDMRCTHDGVAVTSMSIATTYSWFDKGTGEKKQETEWHRVVLYNRLGEVAGQYLKKGSSVYIEGRLKTRKWQDKETGQDRYATDVIADQMQMLGGKSDHYDDSGFDNTNQTPQQKQMDAKAYQDAKNGTTRPAATPPSFENMDDDIPF